MSVTGRLKKADRTLSQKYELQLIHLKVDAIAKTLENSPMKDAYLQNLKELWGQLLPEIVEYYRKKGFHVDDLKL